METEIKHTHKQITWVQGGSRFFQLIDELIRNAQKTIHLHTYIFDNDTTGTKVADALMQRSKEAKNILRVVIARNEAIPHYEADNTHKYIEDIDG